MFSTATKIQIIFVLVAICAAFYVYTKCKEIDSIQNRINVMSSQLQELQTCKPNMCQVSSPGPVRTTAKSAAKHESVSTPESLVSQVNKGGRGQSQVTSLDGHSKHVVVETVDIQIPSSTYDDDDEESICSFEIKNILKSITSFADDVCSNRESPVVIIKEIPDDNVIAKNKIEEKKGEDEDESADDEDEEEGDDVVDVAHMTDEDITKLRVDDMREILRNNDVDTKGTRPILLDKVKRLREKMSNNNNTNESR